tara:strand:- start:390 stop:554 length:165 start_codon:yes stop_codon:yes gene_type:complete
MILKKSPLHIQDKNSKDLDDSNDYLIHADSIRDQKFLNAKSNTVHRRRDLDSLG